MSLIGYSSTDPVYMSAGSVAQDESGSTDFIDFYEAFTNDGFTLTNTMKDYYASIDTGRDNDAGGMFVMAGSDYNIFDFPVADHQDVMDKAAAEADTAVIVIGRTGGEGGDEPLDMAEYTNGDAGKSYLQLQDTELEMVKYCEDNYENVIVIIDSSNAMELGFLDDEKIDAAIWIGGPGTTGIQAVADIVCGKVNPSGKLPDTYAYDLKSAPSYYTGSAGTYTNYDAFDGSARGYNNQVDGGVNYDVEGIYVGYRYYETAAVEGYIDYDKTVQYPFGYGLSYTSFDWEITNSSFGDVHGDITMDVKVTNTGDVAGKDVVELYFTAPYTKGGIEKSAKELGAFAKTKELAPGESQTLTLSMKVDELASYDYQGEGCYVADEGSYEFHLQTDSHNDKEGCQVLTYNVEKKLVYNEDGVGARSCDQTVAKNAFDIAYSDGNIGNTIPYVSRADFAGTHPANTMGKHITEMSLAMGDEMVEYMNTSEGGSDVRFENDDNYVTESKVPVATNQKNGLTVEDFAHFEDFDDEGWDLLVNQMSVEEMVTLVSDCAYGTPAIESIGKKLVTDVDGPAGVSSQNLNYYGNEYTAEVVMAATWNTELIGRVGKNIARECNAAGISGWYAPGVNIHRTPFNGRCGEYFSEDPLLSGKIVASEIQSVQNEGVYVYVKHFACNDTDAKRGGMYTWINEQELREIQLQAFQYAIVEGGALNVMEGYNRIGPMECSTSYALNHTVLRDEWGFKGGCLTDGYAPMIGSQEYNNPDLQIRAGAGMLLFIGGATPEGTVTEKTTGSQKGLEMLHDECKRMLYVYCNSSAMEVSRDYTPYWIIPVVILNLIVFGVCAFFLFRLYGKKKKQE
jgi:beta-glucosidase